jgi:hypothetical protein
MTANIEYKALLGTFNHVTDGAKACPKEAQSTELRAQGTEQRRIRFPSLEGIGVGFRRKKHRAQGTELGDKEP